MRFIGLGMAALAATAFTVGAAQADKVIIKKDHYDHGRHLGWQRGHHEGWRAHGEGSKKVIIKHRDHD